MSAGSPVQPVLTKVLFTKRCAPRFHAECTGHCVESFHEEPIREKNVIFKKVASWYPGIPVRGSASSLFSRFAGSHPFTGSPIRFASVFPVPGSDPVQSHAAREVNAVVIANRTHISINLQASASAADLSGSDMLGEVGEAEC